MNSVNLIGNLVADAEMRFTTSGKAVANFSVAHNKKLKDEEKASFFDCVIWDKAAEALTKYLVKGKKVGLTGELNQRRWKTDAGENRSKVEIIVYNVDFLSKREESEIF
jgi:single-strand DNA-binding protein